jgi:hypothetical protein
MKQNLKINAIIVVAMTNSIITIILLIKNVCKYTPINTLKY